MRGLGGRKVDQQMAAATWWPTEDAQPCTLKSTCHPFSFFVGLNNLYVTIHNNKSRMTVLEISCLNSPPPLPSPCLDAEPSDLNAKMDFNGSHRVARSLTGYITDQSSTPGVSAGSQTVQETHNEDARTHMHAHTCPLTHARTQERLTGNT